MSGHYEEREIKIVEEKFFGDNEWPNVVDVSYELRAYNEDGAYEILASSDDLLDLLRKVR